MKKWFVYIARCGDDSLYTGCTDDIEKRLEKHNKGKGAKYTRGRLPITMVYCEEQENHSAALKRELAIKKLTRTSKMALIATNK